MAYNYLFWGFVLLMFDINVNGFDIIPDILGFILLYKGLSILEYKNINFEKAKRITIVMIILSIMDYILVYINPISIGLLLLFTYIILDFIIVYRICMGIAEEAFKVDDYELEDKAIKRLKIFIGVYLLGLLSITLPINILFVIISMISYIFIIELMRMASYDLDGE